LGMLPDYNRYISLFFDKMQVKCTLMYLAGCDILTAKNQMGHADIKTTLAIYSHLDTYYKRKSMSKLDDFLNKQEAV